MSLTMIALWTLAQAVTAPAADPAGGGLEKLITPGGLVAVFGAAAWLLKQALPLVASFKDMVKSTIDAHQGMVTSVHQQAETLAVRIQATSDEMTKQAIAAAEAYTISNKSAEAMLAQARELFKDLQEANEKRKAA